MKNRIPKRIILIAVSLLCISISVPAQNEEGPGYYKILKKRKSPLVIPFTMHNRKPVMELKINGEMAHLMIDNGVLWDEVWLFGTPLVDAAGLGPKNEINVSGAGEGGSTAAYTSDPVELAFDDIIFYDQPVIVSPAAAGFGKMFPGTDGQLCNTFFKHFITEFDFIKSEIRLYKKEEFEPHKNGDVIPINELPSGSFEIPFSFVSQDGTVFKGMSDIDFGGMQTFMAALDNGHAIILPETHEVIGMAGASGKMDVYLADALSFTFGKYRFDHPRIAFADGKLATIHHGNLGVVGQPLFEKFTIAFDYFDNQIFVVPNKNFDGVEVSNKLQ